MGPKSGVSYAVTSDHVLHASGGSATLISQTSTTKNVSRIKPTVALLAAAVPGQGLKLDERPTINLKNLCEDGAFGENVERSVADKLNHGEGKSDGGRPGVALMVGGGVYDPTMDLRMDQQVMMGAHSILNKLTMANIKKSSSYLCDLHITEAEELMEIVGIIFSKAIEDEGVCHMYAVLCNILKDKMPEFQEEDLVLGKTQIKNKTFKRYLLSKCQEEFECANLDDEATDAVVAKAAKLRRSRIRKLGIVKFIGELFRQEILNENIMHDSIKRLVSKDEVKLECLCTLMAAIGKQLDRKEAKLYMDNYFAQMQVIANEIGSQRLRTLLLDTLDLRNNRFAACFVFVQSYFFLLFQHSFLTGAVLMDLDAV